MIEESYPGTSFDPLTALWQAPVLRKRLALADFAHTLPEQRPLEPLATHQPLQCFNDAVGHAFFINRQ
jgi:hypothetical protein